MKYILILTLVFLIRESGFAQLSDTTKVYEIGAVVIEGQQPDTLSSISASQIKSNNLLDIAKGLNTISGVVMNNTGARNETSVLVRGFDSRQVPLFWDGIPIYISYDGYIDFSRFNTFGIASIQVNKGFSSMMYGPNALGGSINIITSAPTHKHELSATAGWMSYGYLYSISYGTKRDKFYAVADLSRTQRNFVPLSEDFTATKTENGDLRENSYSGDTRAMVKIGFQPNEKHHHAITFMHQTGEKGNPVYAGTDLLNPLYSKPRYWQWPYWNTSNIYYNGNINISKNSSVGIRAYYTIYENSLWSYDDATYTSISKPYAFKSFYNDYSNGIITDYTYKGIAKNTVKFSAQYRNDIHKEYNEGEPQRKASDLTTSFAMEDTWYINARFKSIAGISFNTRQSLQADNYTSTKTIELFPKNNSRVWNANVMLNYKMGAKQGVYVSTSYRSRFATLKDRYSYKMGTAMPNPNLAPEKVWHTEAGYVLTLKKINWTNAFYYSQIQDLIQMVDNAVFDGVKYYAQAQNAGRAMYYGFETAVNSTLTKSIRLMANYSFIERINNSRPDIYLTDVPSRKLYASVQYTFLKRNAIIITEEYNSKRYSTSYGVSTSPYWITSAIYSYGNNTYSIQAGINNVFDKNYQIKEGYPEPGRNYFIRLNYTFKK